MIISISCRSIRDSGDLGNDNEEYRDEGDDVLEFLIAAANNAGWTVKTKTSLC